MCGVCGVGVGVRLWVDKFIWGSVCGQCVEVLVGGTSVGR